MPKEYQFICPGCGTLFYTVMKDRAYCRSCISAGRASLDTKPVPSPLQAAKWKAARRAKRLMEEREVKIKYHGDVVNAVRDAKAGDIIMLDEEV